jgi:Raf kinase inhibitor-like YbhB/YbcL family protein
MKALTLPLALLVTLLVAACGGSTTSPNNGQPNNGEPTALYVSSGAFDPGTAIPSDYTCDAGGLQPPVSWTGAPSNSAEFALVMVDQDANNFVHWVVVGIPGDETALSNPLPDGATAGVNGKGTTGYTPPCPPSGTHHYVITVYALSSTLGLGASATADQVRSAAADKTLATGTLTGTYSRGGASAS